ncbi:MAG TPA: metallophosphoesterase [Armatimonadota bacterium]
MRQDTRAEAEAAVPAITGRIAARFGLTLSRRRFLMRAAAAMAVAAAGDVGYTFSPRITRRSLWFPSLPDGWDGARVLHLSDFHHGPLGPGAYLQRVFEQARALPHDIAFLTGDFVSESSRFASIYPDLLRGWSPPLGVWATLGNHDHYYEPEVVRQAVMRAGAPVLTNQATRLTRNGDPLWLIGVDDPSTDNHDLPAAMRPVRDKAFRLLLAHSPDIVWSLGDSEVDLVLTGHTHGGQVCLPNGAAVVCPTNLGPDYARGRFLWRSATLYVNRGIGVVGLPFRAFCPPEIALLTLRRGIEP